MKEVLGAVCLGLVGFYGNRYYYDLGAQAAEWINLFLSKDQLDVWKPVMFFMLVVTTFLLNTLCVLLSCVLSFNTATFMSKTVYGVLYNFMAFALYLPSSITLILSVKKREIQSYKDGYYYDPFMAAGILGTIISVLYFLGTILSYRSYRGTL
ncbi:uncharacterized protein [Periplaneta americana]|uniref:uncharacterized protein isoform X2 n=1 Tax=Periplaneta americana TaxID=6978 RepID=UPI0037E87104